MHSSIHHCDLIVNADGIQVLLYLLVLHKNVSIKANILECYKLIKT